MIAVSKSAGATVANDLLSFWAQDDTGVLVDAYAVAFEIFNEAGTSVVARASLNLADAPAGNRLGLGHYAGAWNATSATAGRYFVRWYYKLESTDAEASFDVVFEVVAKPYPAGSHYCAVQDVKDEGAPSTLSEAQLQAAISRASSYVEFFTGRKFYAQRKTVFLDGSSSRALMLDEPIVAIELIEVSDPLGGLAIVDNTLLIYNRHLRQGLTSPDDRDNPKLEFFHGNDLTGSNEASAVVSRNYLYDLIWPRGRQNVQVTGLFGYTEPDGSFVGATPALIREVTKLLVFKLLPKMSAGVQAFGGGAVILEGTRDQQVQFAQPWLKGGQTGDWSIDSILAGFMRPPIFGAA